MRVTSAFDLTSTAFKPIPLPFPIPKHPKRVRVYIPRNADLFRAKRICHYCRKELARNDICVANNKARHTKYYHYACARKVNIL